MNFKKPETMFKIIGALLLKGGTGLLKGSLKTGIGMFKGATNLNPVAYHKENVDDDVTSEKGKINKSGYLGYALMFVFIVGRIFWPERVNWDLMKEIFKLIKWLFTLGFL